MTDIVERLVREAELSGYGNLATLLETAAGEIEALREEVRSLGEMSDACTFHALKEICANCRCKRATDRR